MSTVTNGKPTKVTFIDPAAPVGTILSRLKQIGEQMVEVGVELGQVNSAITTQRALALQEIGVGNGSSATAAKQHADIKVAGFVAESIELQADYDALKEESVYLHTLLKYLHN